MNKNNIQSAAEMLWQTWQQGKNIETLPEHCRPSSIEDAYAIQTALAKTSGQAVVGWKIAATSAAGQAHIGVDGPLAGRLFADRVSENATTVSLGAGNIMNVAEMEFAFRLAQDFPARTEPYTQDEVIAGVASLHSAIEIPNSRFSDFVGAGGLQLIADDACAHRFVFGDKITADWRIVDLSRHPVKLLINGKTETQGVGADALGDPRIALTWIVNNHTLQGDFLRAGQIITTGVCGQPSPIRAGDELMADFAEFGQIKVSITG